MNEVISATSAAANLHGSRIERAAERGVGEQIQRLLAAGTRGLPWAYDEKSGEFAQTLRRVQGPSGITPWREGNNLRYAAMAVLGISRLSVADQRQILAGSTAVALAGRIQGRATGHPDPGVIALSAWASAEVSGRYARALFTELDGVLNSGKPIDTVSLSWMLTAATAVGGEGIGASIAERTGELLLDAQGPNGIFPHVYPATAQNRWRRHVGSFADQVYPIQALARLHALNGDWVALEAANLTADRICELQGADGQWWWHYDVRTGDVVERFPVYSVHQHAMAPMVLFELAEAGGADHIAEVIAGVRWIDEHPEVDEELLLDDPGVVWRKVGRREPAKAARKLSAVTTSICPGMHLPGLDRVFPPNRVDHECRPYELGWLLYAWLPPQIGDHHE